MAVSTGIGPHRAWLTVGGAVLPIEKGSVQQDAINRTAKFSGTLPMGLPGAADLFANLGDNSASISVMTRGVTATLVTGELDEVDFDDISRKLHFAGRDPSAKLHENKTSEKWINKKPSDIVQDLIGRLGLSGNVTSSPVKAGKMLQQDYVKLSSNISFAEVIQKMAEFDGVRWWIDANGTFHYVPFGSADSTYAITINQQQQPISADCLALRIRRNIQAAKTQNVDMSAWHPHQKQVIRSQSTIAGNGGPRKYSFHIPAVTQDHLTQRARSHAAQIARHELTVSATVVGDPTVSAGMGLQLNGTLYFDQQYDIDTVRHDFGMGGHRTHITARSAKEGRQAT